jgi:hypothetical protein
MSYKTVELGDIVDVKGDIGKVICYGQGKDVTIESFDKWETCPHCGEKIRKATYTMLESSPNFQNDVNPVKTIKI